MLAIIEGLDAEQWGGFLVPHKYMGPLPAFFYPVAQLVDYAVHSWDIRQGAGGSARHGRRRRRPARAVLLHRVAVDGRVRRRRAVQLGVRVDRQQRRRHAGVGDPRGRRARAGRPDDLPLVLEFDAASFVLTAMGRINGGTARGDAALAERFCNLFFRI